MADGVWTQETYEGSVSSRCWWYTAYSAGWAASRSYGADLTTDDELRQIVAMEQALGTVPEWAQRLVVGAINYLPPCGHCHFPLAYLETVSAIGAQTPPSFLHGCYTVRRDRKRRLQDYLLCLDAWLAGAEAGAASRELAVVGAWPRLDWEAVCADLWRVLGEPSELKELLIEQLLHRQRWWLKATVWDDDRRDQFCRDQYLGNVAGAGEHYGNADFADPFFLEDRSRRSQRRAERLSELSPDWPWFRDAIEWSWLCAPKAFRFLEKLLWCIGQEQPRIALASHPLAEADRVPGFLRCEDTWPDVEAAGRWWATFVQALDDWWQVAPARHDRADPVRGRLGATTDAKRWLVRLLRHKLRLYETGYTELGWLRAPRPASHRGVGPV